MACQAKVRKSTEVFIPATSIENQIQILVEGYPKSSKTEPICEKEKYPDIFPKIWKGPELGGNSVQNKDLQTDPNYPLLYTLSKAFRKWRT